MTLFLFFLGLAIITIIARYNESNKLFWALLTAYTMSFVGTKLVYDNFVKDESKNTFEQVQPTQGPMAASGSFQFLVTDDISSATTKVTSKPVSKANVPAVERSITLSDVSGVTEGLYLHVLPNPPNGVEIVDDS